MLRLEMDMMDEERRQEEIKGYLQGYPEGLTPSEKKVRANNLEQSVYIRKGNFLWDKLQILEKMTLISLIKTIHSA